jgi:hypothetical protein
MPAFWVPRERVGERVYNKCNCLILNPLILPSTPQVGTEKSPGRRRDVLFVVLAGIHVQRVITACINSFIHDVTDNHNHGLRDSSATRYILVFHMFPTQ